MRGGLPHSEIPGSQPARGSPGLIAACHVLHRLSAPRHPPDALLSLAPPRRRRRRLTGVALSGARGALRPTSQKRTTTTITTERSRELTSKQACTRLGRRARAGVPGRSIIDRAGPSRGRPCRASPPHDRKEPVPGRRMARAAPSSSRDSSRIPPRGASVGGPGPTRTADLALIRRAL